MRIEGQVAVVTGAASGIGRAVAEALAARRVAGLALVDRSETVREVAAGLNDSRGVTRASAFTGDVTNPDFRRAVFDEAARDLGRVSICVPAAGITRDALVARIDSQTGRAVMYPVEDFEQVIRVDLTAPVYWAVEMVARIGEDRWQRGRKRWDPEERLEGAVIFIGSVSAQGNQGQIAYAAAKSGLEGAAATLMKEAMFHGVRCMVLHPGYTDTPMVHKLGAEYISQRILPFTQLRRLIAPEEIADAVCFMIGNPAVSGEIHADAGWHPSA